MPTKSKNVTKYCIVVTVSNVQPTIKPLILNEPTICRMTVKTFMKIKKNKIKVHVILRYLIITDRIITAQDLDYG